MELQQYIMLQSYKSSLVPKNLGKNSSLHQVLPSGLRSSRFKSFGFPQIFASPTEFPSPFPLFSSKSEAITTIDCQSNPTISTVARFPGRPVHSSRVLCCCSSPLDGDTTAPARLRWPRDSLAACSRLQISGPILPYLRAAAAAPRHGDRPPEIAEPSPYLSEVGVRSTMLAYLTVVRDFSPTT